MNDRDKRRRHLRIVWTDRLRHFPLNDESTLDESVRYLVAQRMFLCDGVMARAAASLGKSKRWLEMQLDRWGVYKGME